jgi:pseudaminic acid synthase
MNEFEFTEMVHQVRLTESAIGQINYSLSEKQNISRAHCRSLYIVENIKSGEIFTEKNLKSIRPGFGLHPRYYNEILGKKAKIDIDFGTRLTLDLIA